MKRVIMIPLCALVLAGVGYSDELLVNGDFEQPLDVGWTDTVVGTTGSASFTRSDTLGQPSPGYAACVYKTLASYASLSQTVDVPNTNLTLQFDGRLGIGGGSSTCWPVAAFIVRYLDAAGLSLGNTRIYLHDQYCTWANSDTQHLVDITSPGAWTPFTLDIASELTLNLRGVPPASVRKVTIDLFAFDNGT
jgi:uncharacterized protein (DUF779 family)